MPRERVRPFVPLGWDFVADDGVPEWMFRAIARLMMEHQRARIPLGHPLRLHRRAAARCVGVTQDHGTRSRMTALSSHGYLLFEVSEQFYTTSISKSLIDLLRVPRLSILYGSDMDGGREVERLRVQRSTKTSRVATERNSASTSVSGSNSNGNPKSVGAEETATTPEKWTDVAAELAATTHLNRPVLYDWLWWEKLDRIYESNNDLDFLVEIRKMDEWLGRKRSNGLKKDWKRFVANWLSNATEAR